MAKSNNNAPLNFWAILVYVWIFCVYMILFKTIGEIILFIIDMSPLKDTKDNTIGYGSPIFWTICFIYEYLLSSWYLMIVYAVLLFFITIIFLILWLIYHIIKPLGFLTGNAHKKSPFKDVMEIINMLDRKSKFTDVLQYYRDELIKILMSTSFFKSLTESNPANAENFTVTKDVEENFTSSPENTQIQYIDEDLREELKDKYKEKNYYYIDAYRHNSHKKSAAIYKSLKILTPSMDESAIGKVYSANFDAANNINITYLTNLNNIK
jgi:hypothetical protein